MSRIDNKRVMDIILDSKSHKNTVIDGNRSEEPFLGHIVWERFGDDLALDIFDSSDDQHIVINEAHSVLPRVEIYQLADLECWFKVVEFSSLNKAYFIVSFDDVEAQTGDIEDIENFEDQF